MTCHAPMAATEARLEGQSPVMADADGAITYRLLRGARYLKDNRLLPRGWRAAAASADIAPVGVDDPDFAGGGDRVSLAIDVGGRTGPFTIDVSLLYQTLGARYAAELLAIDTAEVRALRAMLERANRRPEPLATATATLRR
jgi:hypothetical protein